ncbi:MAG: Gfo/Idh/MocA family oxidoreductase [Haloarculaceae archaeon]
MDDTLRAGVVGVGGLGTRLGAALEASAAGAVAAVADVDEAARERAGEAFDVPARARFAEYERMLDETDLDAVVIATPHTLHYDQVVAAMERDLHVLCEKPLTTDLADARDLVARDRRRDEVLMVGYQRHIQGPYVAAREVVDSFDGPPKFVTAEITQNWIASQKNAWRANPDLSGGGQLYDTGSHVLDFLLWATGLEPTAVDASMVFWDDERRVDTQASLAVEFETDAVASVAVSGDAPQVREHHRIWGDDGAVYVDGRGWNDRQVRVVDESGAERFPRTTDRYPNKVEAFLEAVAEGTEPPSTAEHALCVTAVTEAAYESARTGEQVDVDL